MCLRVYMHQAQRCTFFASYLCHILTILCSITSNASEALDASSSNNNTVESLSHGHTQLVVVLFFVIHRVVILENLQSISLLYTFKRS